MRDCVKFPGDWSHRSKDRAMCQFFTMAAVCQLVSFLWVWVTHKDYLMVFIIFQNLVE